jgi:hypothetical protein
MPVITTAAAQQTPPTPVIVPELGRVSATYYDPFGTAWPLTTRSCGWYTVADGVSGLGAALYTLTADAQPRGGASLRHAQPEPRTIVWPLRVYGRDHMEFVGRWRALAKAFTDTLRNGPGLLEIARPDGTSRQTRVFYQEGFDGRGDRNASSSLWDVAVITLWCEDPYWVDPVPQLVHREYAVGEDFFAPFPSVSSGQVLGATAVHNPGDVLVWPEWTITGPASLVTFTHEDSGEEFVLDPSATAVGHGALVAGEQVTVRTDPAQVRGPDGTNWIGALNWPGAVLWSLRPGSNQVAFRLDGSGQGSAVDLSFNPRYETA